MRVQREELPPASEGFCSPIREIHDHVCFQAFIMLCILFNLVTLLGEHYKMSKSWSDDIDFVNSLLSGIYLVEALLKLSGHGPRAMIKSGWDKLDTSLALVATAELVIAMFPNELGGTDGTMAVILRRLKALRSLRLIRLLRSSPYMSLLGQGLVTALPALGHVTLMLILSLYIWGVLGVQLFGEIKYEDNMDVLLGLSKEQNFSDFPHSLHTLTRIAFGGAWAQLMKDCATGDGVDGNTRGFSYVFFLSYVGSVRLALIGIASTAVIEGMRSAEKLEEVAEPSKPQHFAAFRRSWAWFDTSGTGYLPSSRLPGLIGALSAPLGVRPISGKAQYMYGIDIAVAKVNPTQQLSIDLTNVISLALMFL